MKNIRYSVMLGILFFGCMIKSAKLVDELKKLEINNVQSYCYISCDEITPGQLRYSQLNVTEKIIAAIKNKQAFFDITSGWHYKYNNDSSILETALPVIIAPFGPVLVDGHHDTMANIALYAKNIPVFVMHDFSSLSEEEFWKTATDKGLVYPYTIKNEYKVPTSFSELQDDPNRFFAALVARKCTKDKQTGEMIAIASPKTALADYPLWVKFGNEIPFIEFKISDLLMKHGILYDNAWEASVNEEFVEKARLVLIKNQIKNLKVIEERIKVTDGSELARTLCIRN